MSWIDRDAGVTIIGLRCDRCGRPVYVDVRLGLRKRYGCGDAYEQCICPDAREVA